MAEQEDTTAVATAEERKDLDSDYCDIGGGESNGLDLAAMLARNLEEEQEMREEARGYVDLCKQGLASEREVYRLRELRHNIFNLKKTRFYLQQTAYHMREGEDDNVEVVVDGDDDGDDGNDDDDVGDDTKKAIVEDDDVDENLEDVLDSNKDGDDEENAGIEDEDGDIEDGNANVILGVEEEDKDAYDEAEEEYTDEDNVFATNDEDEEYGDEYVEDEEEIDEEEEEDDEELDLDMIFEEDSEPGSDEDAERDEEQGTDNEDVDGEDDADEDNFDYSESFVDDESNSFLETESEGSSWNHGGTHTSDTLDEESMLTDVEMLQNANIVGGSELFQQATVFEHAELLEDEGQWCGGRIRSGTKSRSRKFGERESLPRHRPASSAARAQDSNNDSKLGPTVAGNSADQSRAPSVANSLRRGQTPNLSAGRRSAINQAETASQVTRAWSRSTPCLSNISRTPTPLMDSVASPLPGGKATYRNKRFSPHTPSSSIQHHPKRHQANTNASSSPNLSPLKVPKKVSQSTVAIRDQVASQAKEKDLECPGQKELPLTRSRTGLPSRRPTQPPGWCPPMVGSAKPAQRTGPAAPSRPHKYPRRQSKPEGGAVGDFVAGKHAVPGFPAQSSQTVAAAAKPHRVKGPVPNPCTRNIKSDSTVAPRPASLPFMAANNSTSSPHSPQKAASANLWTASDSSKTGGVHNLYLARSHPLRPGGASTPKKTGDTANLAEPTGHPARTGAHRSRQSGIESKDSSSSRTQNGIATSHTAKTFALRVDASAQKATVSMSRASKTGSVLSRAHGAKVTPTSTIPLASKRPKLEPTTFNRTPSTSGSSYLKRTSPNSGSANQRSSDAKSAASNASAHGPCTPSWDTATSNYTGSVSRTSPSPSRKNSDNRAMAATTDSGAPTKNREKATLETPDSDTYGKKKKKKIFSFTSLGSSRTKKNKNIKAASKTPGTETSIGITAGVGAGAVAERFNMSTKECTGTRTREIKRQPGESGGDFSPSPCSKVATSKTSSAASRFRGTKSNAPRLHSSFSGRPNIETIDTSGYFTSSRSPGFKAASSAIGNHDSKPARSNKAGPIHAPKFPNIKAVVGMKEKGAPRLRHFVNTKSSTEGACSSWMETETTIFSVVRRSPASRKTVADSEDVFSRLSRVRPTNRGSEYATSRSPGSQRTTSASKRTSSKNSTTASTNPSPKNSSSLSPEFKKTDSSSDDVFSRLSRSKATPTSNEKQTSTRTRSTCGASAEKPVLRTAANIGEAFSRLTRSRTATSNAKEAAQKTPETKAAATKSEGASSRMTRFHAAAPNDEESVSKKSVTVSNVPNTERLFTKVNRIRRTSPNDNRVATTSRRARSAIVPNVTGKECSRLTGAKEMVSNEKRRASRRTKSLTTASNRDRSLLKRAGMTTKNSRTEWNSSKRSGTKSAPFHSGKTSTRKTSSKSAVSKTDKIFTRLSGSNTGTVSSSRNGRQGHPVINLSTSYPGPLLTSMPVDKQERKRTRRSQSDGAISKPPGYKHPAFCASRRPMPWHQSLRQPNIPNTIKRESPGVEFNRGIGGSLELESLRPSCAWTEACSSPPDEGRDHTVGENSDSYAPSDYRLHKKFQKVEGLLKESTRKYLQKKERAADDKRLKHPKKKRKRKEILPAILPEKNCLAKDTHPMEQSRKTRTKGHAFLFQRNQPSTSLPSKGVEEDQKESEKTSKDHPKTDRFEFSKLREVTKTVAHLRYEHLQAVERLKDFKAKKLLSQEKLGKDPTKKQHRKRASEAKTNRMHAQTQNERKKKSSQRDSQGPMSRTKNNRQHVAVLQKTHGEKDNVRQPVKGNERKDVERAFPAHHETMTTETESEDTQIDTQDRLKADELHQRIMEAKFRYLKRLQEDAVKETDHEADHFQGVHKAEDQHHVEDSPFRQRKTRHIPTTRRHILRPKPVGLISSGSSIGEPKLSASGPEIHIGDKRQPEEGERAAACSERPPPAEGNYLGQSHLESPDEGLASSVDDKELDRRFSGSPALPGSCSSPQTCPVPSGP